VYVALFYFYTMRILFTFLVVFITFVSFSQTTISGEVKDNQGKPIQFATVFLKTNRVGGVTTDQGKFSFNAKNNGADTLIVNASGFEQFKKPLVFEGTEILLSIVLKSKTKQLKTIVINAGTIEATNERAVAVLRPLDIVTTAGGQGDIVGAIQTLPGVQRNGGDQTGLQVRGGDVNESNVIIDGMISQNAFNSSIPGVSQRSRFNPFQFKGTSFSSGGYSARYGQALSAILDLQTNDLPEKSTFNAGLNMAGVSLSGSKLMGNNAVEYSGNYLNLSPFYGITPTNVNYYNVPEGGSFSTRYVSKLDSSKGIFKMNFSRSYTKTGVEINNPTTVGSKIRFGLENNNTYLNTSFRYNVRPGKRYFTSLSYSDNTDNILFGIVPLLRKDSRLQGRAEMKSDIGERYDYTTGFEYQHIQYEQKFDTLLAGFTESIGAYYYEGEYKGGTKFAFKPGVRVEYSALLKKGNVSPRFAFAYKSSENGQFSFASGIFYQSANSNYLIYGYRPDFQISTHYMLNYQWIKNSRVFRIEGYYKDYQQLILEKGVAYSPNQFRFVYGQIDNSGSGYAQGIDFFWRDKDLAKNLDYWISYSYVDTKRLYQNYVSKATPDYVSPHNLNVVMKYLVEKISTNFSFTYSYASGRPYYNPNNPVFLGDKTKAYQNLALTASYLKTFKKKIFAVFYVSLDNILNTHNVLGYRYSADGSQRYEVLPPLYRAVFVGMNFSFSQFKQDEL
jgi:hypothetical protein